MKRRVVITGTVATLTAGIVGTRAMSASDAAFVVPPEEDQHERTFMQWPASRRVHPDNEFRRQLQETIAEVANTIAEFEPVVMLASGIQHKWARQFLSSKVDLWEVPTEDLWCRDSGPLFAKRANGELVVSHIQFNGWGNRQVHSKDGDVAANVASILGAELIPAGLRGEPGGVEHDGHGLLMAHESSWVHENRNPGVPRAEVARRLLKAYGATRMIWAPGLKDQDITDYHIDSLARFSGRGRVLINLPQQPDPADPFHQAALDTYARLKAARLEIDVIPEPNSTRIKSRDFVASYVNYYVCNGAVIASQFGDSETDSAAREALKKHYPDREIIMLDVDALGEVGGGIHCATQQMPSA